MTANAAASLSLSHVQGQQVELVYFFFFSSLQNDSEYRPEEYSSLEKEIECV